MKDYQEFKEGVKLSSDGGEALKKEESLLRKTWEEVQARYLGAGKGDGEL